MTVSPFTRRAIEWRHAWPVRFAHHPLCARHRHETWHIGSVYLCRGCVSLMGGLALGPGSVIIAGGPWTGLVAAMPSWIPASSERTRGFGSTRG